MATDGGKVTTELLHEELSCKATMTVFGAEISSLRLELRQEIEAIWSQTTTSLYGLRQELGDEINKLRRALAQAATE